MAGWILLVGCSVRCLTVKTSAPLHPRRAHPAELLPRRRQARPSTLGVLPHREGDAVDPLTSSPNSLSPSRRESWSVGRGRCGSARGPVIAAAAVRAGVRGRRFVQICCKNPDRAEAPEEDHQYSALSSTADPGPVRVVAGDSDIPAP